MKCAYLGVWWNVLLDMYASVRVPARLFQPPYTACSAAVQSAAVVLLESVAALHLLHLQPQF